MAATVTPTPTPTPTPAPVSRIGGGRALLGLGAIGLALAMARDSMNGSLTDKWEMRYQHKIQERSMNKYRYQWGFYSGQPFFDKMAKDLNRIRIDGPFGLRNSWTKAKVYTAGFFHDVVMKNTIPLALGVAGLYGGFGAKNVHKPFQLFWNRFGAGIKSGLGKVHLPNNFGKVAGDALEAVGRGIGKLFTNGRAKVTLPFLGILGFGAHRLTRVHQGEEQRDFFGYNHRPSGQYWDN